MAPSSKTTDDCIRCPDPETAKANVHAKLEWCLSDFRTHASDKGPPTHTADQLWWGFPSGPVPRDLDLSDAGACKKLQQAAIDIGRQFKSTKKESRAEEEARVAAAVEAKGDATWQAPGKVGRMTITKEALEATLLAVEEEKERQRVLRKAGGAVGVELMKLAPGAQDADDGMAGEGRSGEASVSGRRASKGSADGQGLRRQLAAVPDPGNTTNGDDRAGIETPPQSKDPDFKPAPPLRESGGGSLGSVDGSTLPDRTVGSSGGQSGELRPAAPKNVAPYSNPLHQNPKTGDQQKTNQDNALSYARGVAKRTLEKDGCPLTDQDITAEMAKFGLRSSFATPGDNADVYTNHLEMQWPKEIHIYAVDMIRDHTTNGHVPIRVKKNADKRLVIDMLRTTHYRQHLDNVGNNDRHRKWVTDGDLIWSVVPLFDPNDASIGPPSLYPNDRVQYVNEMGATLDLEEIHITSVRTIDLSRHVGQMFYDTSTAAFDDSDPGLISRGLNAFFSRFARETQMNVSPSANKSFATGQPVSLDPGPQRTLLALKGFFLSVRPGIESMYLNVNNATSPFFEPILVSEFIQRARATRSDGEIRAVLKGVKVRIMYQTRTNFTSEGSRMRFVTCVGATVLLNNGTRRTSQYIGNTQITIPNQNGQPQNVVLPGVSCSPGTQAQYGTPTPHDWYSAGPNTVLHAMPDFPTPALRLAADEWAINVGSNPGSRPGGVEWYPASQLMIQPFQRFGGRLTGPQTTNMLNTAVYPPTNHWQRILSQQLYGGMHHLGYAGNPNAGNPAGGNRSGGNLGGLPQPVNQTFLRAANMQAGIDFIQIPGKWLPRPTLLYGRHQSLQHGQPTVAATPRTFASNEAPGRANWNLANTGFATQARLPSLLVLSLLARALPVNGPSNSQASLATMLRRQLFTHGLIGSPNATGVGAVNVRWQHANPGPSGMSLQWEAGLRQAIATLRGNLQGAFPPVLILLDGHSMNDYACVKRAADMHLGVHTICAVRGKSWPSWNAQTVSNIALKYNMKGSPNGCDNHHFTTASLRLLREGSQADTIVIGADVTHPGKGSAPATPSIAAVVGSADDEFMQFPGSMRLQRGGKEDIVDLSGMMRERLIEWARRHNNTLPKKVLFYRDGVSESQYDILRRRELPQVQIAYNEAWNILHPGQAGNTGTPPPDHSRTDWTGWSRSDRVEKEQTADQEWANGIARQEDNRPFKMTFVVVGKRHNTRFYPTDHHEMPNNNVKPGLVVDQVITHPYSMDFYLQSHEPIKGTGRSAHYYVVQNNMELTADSLQSITHTFCYAYAKATRGVSYCAPAYYADRLCDRGRAYLRHYITNDANFQPRPQRHGGQQAETHEQYAEAIKDGIVNNPHYRPYLTQHPVLQQAGGVRMNPWRPALDDTMFYL